ncbi:hypothetical protein [Benzoatithermus flavus]|uniref:Methyl-accepting chemotaxis protein n=1 Tax=Benzoatithermus flavus TaxID=3108223 RepID=A0ABU8XUZ6_9PROT
MQYHPHRAVLRQGHAPVLRSQTAHLVRLRSHLQHLQSWQEESGHAFVSLGQSLQELHRRLQEARNIMTDVVHAILDDSTRTIHQAFEELAQLASALGKLDAQRRTCAARLAEHIQQASNPCSDLEGTLYLLGQLVTLGQINAATIDGESQDFEEFIEEMGRFIEVGRTTAADLRDRLRHLGALVGSAWAEEHRLAASQHETLAVIAGRLRDMASRIRLHQEEAQGWAEDSRQQFGTFQRQIADMVMGLQFHDIARQRLEHVAAGVDRLCRLLADGRLEDEGESLPPERVMRAVQTIGRLEAAQLEYVAVETAAEMSKIAQTVTDLAATARHTEQRFDALASGRRDASRQEPLLAALDLEASAVARLLREQSGNRERMLAGLAESVEHVRAIAGMVERLKRLQDDIRIAGLNATIKSTNLGPSGDALQTIARQMSSHSVEIRQASLVLLERGVEMEATAGTLAGDILEPAGRLAGELSSRLAATVERLRIKEQEIGAANAQVRRLLREIASTLALDTGFVELRERGQALMRAAAAELDAIAAELGPCLDTAPWPELDAILRSRYTMQREREVHARASGEALSGSPEPATEEAAIAVDDLDDVLF